jgi:hypothetical protein
MTKEWHSLVLPYGYQIPEERWLSVTQINLFMHHLFSIKGLIDPQCIDDSDIVDASDLVKVGMSSSGEIGLAYCMNHGPEKPADSAQCVARQAYATPVKPVIVSESRVFVGFQILRSDLSNGPMLWDYGTHFMAICANAVTFSLDGKPMARLKHGPVQAVEEVCADQSQEEPAKEAAGLGGGGAKGAAGSGGSVIPCPPVALGSHVRIIGVKDQAYNKQTGVLANVTRQGLFKVRLDTPPQGKKPFAGVKPTTVFPCG